MKVKPSKNFLIVVAASVLLFWCVSACAQDVRYNFLAGTDFSKYKTYKWVRVPNVKYPNQLFDLNGGSATAGTPVVGYTNNSNSQNMLVSVNSLYPEVIGSRSV